MEEKINNENIDKNKRKNKIILIICLTIILLIVISTIASINIISRIKIGFQIYGDEKCPQNHEIMFFGTSDITTWRCNICGEKIGEGATSSTPEICSICSLITDRCKKCGKLK